MALSILPSCLAGEFVSPKPAGLSVGAGLVPERDALLRLGVALDSARSMSTMMVQHPKGADKVL